MLKKSKIFWIIFTLFVFSSCDFSLIETPSNSMFNSSKITTSSAHSITPSTSFSTSSEMPSTTSVTPSTSSFFPSTSSNMEENWKDIYYDDSSYTSIYDIVQSWTQNALIEGNIKTWGIVSKVFKNREGKQCFYLQSETRNHEHSAIFVDAIKGSDQVKEGNVITIEGQMKFQLDTLTLVNYQNLHIDYENSKDELLPLTLKEEHLSSSYFNELKKQGHRYVSLSQLSIDFQNSDNIFAIMGEETIQIAIEDAMEYSSIYNFFYTVSKSDFVDLQGVLKYGTLDEPILQISITSLNDVKNPFEGAKEITLDNSDNSLTSNRYSTGNYGYFTYQGTTFDYYRTTYSSSDSYFLKLISSSYMNALGGMLSNFSGIPNIVSLELSYSLESKGRNYPVLYYGNSNQLTEYKELDVSSTRFVVQFNIEENIQFFRLESGDTSLYLNSLTIRYLNRDDENEKTYASSGEGLYRNNPSYYQESLIEGASFSLPLKTKRIGNSYEVISEKTYYYYSYSYLESHPECVDKATYTDPIDVANYFNAFHTYPANYVSKSEYRTAKNIFGENTRIWSYYTRDDGYATAVPYRLGDSGTPRYYELDIDIDGTYSNSSRGVGRLVVWLDGWNANGYDNNPVTVFTDDHYATFQEYYNNGEFSYRFNAVVSSRASNFTNYTWGLPLTLS